MELHSASLLLAVALGRYSLYLGCADRKKANSSAPLAFTIVDLFMLEHN